MNHFYKISGIELSEWIYFLTTVDRMITISVQKRSNKFDDFLSSCFQLWEVIVAGLVHVGAMCSSLNVNRWLRLLRICFSQAKRVPGINRAMDIKNIGRCWFQGAVDDVGAVDAIHKSCITEPKWRLH